LHFQYAPTEENLVVNSLFGDGAAATVISRAKPATAQPFCHINYFTSQVYRERQDTISWRIGDNGFRMGLALSNAKDLSGLVPDFVATFLKRHGWRQDDITLWAIHPGGRAILDVCERSLGLAPDALAGSRAILRNYGNMSSPTILFIMAHLLTSNPAASAQGMTLAFGPGIALEGMLWHRRSGDGGLQPA
jgi:predicted naringenin-chalcone synthase